MSMKITGSDNNLYIPNYEAENHASKPFQTPAAEKGDTSSIKVTISEEGKQACRNSVQDGEKNNYEKIIENREELLEHKITPHIHYGGLIGDQLTEIEEREGNCHLPTSDPLAVLEEEASALLEAYANVYDEIVQGYADGTRNIYVADSTNEKGYRKMTLEEEISALDKSYQYYVNFFETQTQIMIDSLPSWERYMAFLERVGAYKSQMLSETVKIYGTMEKEKLPEDISGSLMAAKQKFVRLYTQNQNKAVSIKDLLENIKIFPEVRTHS